MEDIKLFFDSIMRFYQIEVHLYGFTFTFFDMFIFACVLAIVCFLIRGIFF